VTTRRGFLTVLGGVAVAATGMGTFRAVTQGVFAGPTGEAYAAWDAWNPPGDDVLGMVSAAVLAANAHNSQPWLFRMSPDRVDVVADTSRWIGAMDPLYREMQVSLGCAVENLALAAGGRGRTPTVELYPGGATVHLGRGTVDSPLYRAIPHRHTNRAAYHPRPVDLAPFAAMSDDVVQVAWIDKTRFTDLTVRATEAIIADRDQTTDDFAWYRGERDDLRAHKDGVTIDASGQPDLIRAVGKILPASHGTNNSTWLASTRDVQLPTAAAVGTLVVKDPLDPVQRMRAGRLWQRMHLWATTQGLAMQPINQVEERIDREHATGQQPTFGTQMRALVPPNTHPVFSFRVGYPKYDATPSPRRPAQEVLR
jgi:hypothetical protein